MSQLRATGYYATFRGAEYHCTFDRGGEVYLLVEGARPAVDFFDYQDAGIWMKTVALEDVAALDEVRVECTWRGHRFEIAKINGDLAWCDYIDADRRFTWVGAGQLQQTEPGFWSAELPTVELDDVLENRTPLLPRLLAEFRSRPAGRR